MKRFTNINRWHRMLLVFGAVTLLTLAFIPSVALAAVPQLINFQGILRDGSGNPVADGVYSIRFRIYDDSTAGSNLWEEFVDVQVTGGLFNVRLGDTTDLPNSLFEGSVNRFVGVKVGGDPEAAPRTRLISVPFAFHTLKSDSAGTATVALDLTCTGCVDGSEIDATQVQRRVAGTAPLGEYITAINQDGSVVTAADQGATPSGWTDDGTVVRLSTGTDNVGVGTTTPTDRLHIAGTGTAQYLRVESQLTGVPAGLRLTSPDRDWYLAQSVAGPSGSLSIHDIGAGVTRLHIGTNGNVGIGLIDASKKLQVNGSIKVGADDTVFTSHISSNSPLSLQAPAGTTRMFIDDVNGLVGIGMTSPTKKLDVAGSIKVGTNDTVFTSNISSNSPLSLQAPAGTTRIFINDGTGNVGIGTTITTHPLELNGDFEQLGGRILLNDANIANRFHLILHNHSLVSEADNYLAFRIGNTIGGTVERMRIDANGNIGIRTANPLYPLDLNGDFRQQGGSIRLFEAGPTNRFHLILHNHSAVSDADNYLAFRIGNTSGSATEKMRIDASGNVGIGTVSPLNTLDVDGRVVIGTTYAGTVSAAPSQLIVEDRVAIGQTVPASGTRLTVNGGIATAITTLAGGATLGDAHSVVLCDVSGGPFNVSLPSATATNGRQYTIKKITGPAANAVVIDPFGAQTIDGAATYNLLAVNQYITVVSNGSNWFIVANN